MDPNTSPNGLIDKLALYLYSLVAGRDRRLVLGTLLLVIVAGVGASQLYISQDFRRMLPQDSESIQQLLHIDERIGNQSDLYVVIKGPERADNIAYGAELEERLKTLESLRSVTFRRDLDYLEDRALLYLSMSELLEIHDDVKETIRREVAKELALETEGAETVDTAEEEQGLLGENELNERLERYERPAEYSETDEGRVMVLSARPRFQNTDAESSQKLCDEVKALADEVAKKFPVYPNRAPGQFCGAIEAPKRAG